ncbi:MAG: undecaprenyldiphospho-muramoylpentapeptide beta-N-acetylglucosaminyltransferase [Candidatus Hydrogenedentes bacterium]|nr:undecaprenyldiphospho-muramoylpentapeptide beta-N-acetylglucosaminyltransferase [Candidatus Hydrogenedentota bacterium]
MKLMISGGGTGGHTSPAVAIIEELRRRDPTLLLQWVGRRGNIEQRVAERLGIPFRSVPVEGWPRGRKLRKAWVGAKLAVSIGQSMLYLRKFQPQLVLGVGGYVSLPLLFAAQRLGIPTMIHEQNKRLGMANRMLALAAERVFLSYPETDGIFPEHKTMLVGNPVRAGFAHPPAREEACQRFNLNPDIPVVLVSGGSQGARTLNEAMAEAALAVEDGEVQFLWMTGMQGATAAHAIAEKARASVQVFHFIEDMVGACAAADVIVSRAGASSTAEIAVIGRPSILVPYPFATDNHQEENAKAFAAAGAAIVLRDPECTGERLTREIRQLVQDSVRRDVMATAVQRLAHPLAAEKVADEIITFVFERA